MADLLSVGVSGLRAFQRALDVTSHNIANSTTPGYSRQNVSLGTRTPELYGNGYLGTGVNVTDIARSYDELLGLQMRDALGSSARLDVYAGKAETLNNLFGDSTTGLSVSLQRFADAVQGVSNEPNSTAARQVLLSEADGLRLRLQTYDRRLEELNSEINSRIGSEVSVINNSAQAIARLNDQIVAAQTAGGAPNDLLDARDKALQDLSGHIAVSVVKQGDGAWNVFVGNGQALVLGSNASSLRTQRDLYDPSRMTIAYETGASTVDMTSALSGGALGGLLDFRRELLEPVRNQLGQIAAGLASAVNDQHREGVDLRGNPGGDLFALGGVAALPALTNGGSANLTVQRADATALTAADYILEFDGSAWAARRADTGAAVALAGSGTALDPFTADGLSIVVGGAAQAGDRFLVKPTAGAISGMRVLITDPAQIAAAAPIRTAAGNGNTGSAIISAGEVLDASNPQLVAPVSIQFINATTYSVNGSGAFAYTAGSDIDINGWRVRIDGSPAAGDTFTVGPNTGGTGDNRNMLELSRAFGRGILTGGTESINSAVTRFVGNIGVLTNQAKSGSEAQQFIVQDLQTSIDSVSGVNLDEEAANMLRYQQAYQAAAQIIRVTQDMFDSLLAATRR